MIDQVVYVGALAATIKRIYYVKKDAMDENGLFEGTPPYVKHVEVEKCNSKKMNRDGWRKVTVESIVRLVDDLGNEVFVTNDATPTPHNLSLYVELMKKYPDEET